jgi:protoporphyrinogen oxidase
LKLKKRFGRHYWTNIGDESIPFCALIEHTHAFEDKGYNGFKLLYVSNYVEHSHPLWGASDQEVLDAYIQGLKKIRPSFSENEMAEYFIFREKFAQPVPTLGHSRKIPPFAVKDRLHYVSSAQIYPEDRGVSDSIRLAQRFVRGIT